MARRVEKARVRLEENHAQANVTRFARAEEAYRDAGGYRAESEARSITAGLGLAQNRLTVRVGALSGGERRRLELARILFGRLWISCSSTNPPITSMSMRRPGS